MNMFRVVIIDYGMGNLGSVQNALSFLGQRAEISSAPETILRADAFVLPGVGAFGEAMVRLRSTGLIEPLTEKVLHRKTPLLGICLGMQLLAEESFEHGYHRGLGWVPGSVRAIPPAQGIRIPHVGWSETSLTRDHALFRNIETGTCYYYDHSYHLECDPSIVAAYTHYGQSMTAAICVDNIVAAQFHPEKSQRAGLKLMRNFLNIVAECSNT